jgi:hypothetical protein
VGAGSWRAVERRVLGMQEKLLGRRRVILSSWVVRCLTRYINFLATSGNCSSQVLGSFYHFLPRDMCIACLALDAAIGLQL